MERAKPKEPSCRLATPEPADHAQPPGGRASHATDDGTGTADRAAIRHVSKSDEREALKVQLDRDIAQIQRELNVLSAENDAKTEELRKLQRERDPERIARAVDDAVKARTSALEAELVKYKDLLAGAHGEIRELKESKRRLKEANECLKQGK